MLIQESLMSIFESHYTKNTITLLYFHYLAKYLSKQDRVTVFKSFIFPHIIYAYPFLLNSNIGQVKQLKSAYNRAMKILFRIPFLYPSQLLPQSTNIESLSSLIFHHSLIYAYLIFCLLYTSPSPRD